MIDTIQKQIDPFSDDEWEKTSADCELAALALKISLQDPATFDKWEGSAKISTNLSLRRLKKVPRWKLLPRLAATPVDKLPGAVFDKVWTIPHSFTSLAWIGSIQALGFIPPPVAPVVLLK